MIDLNQAMMFVEQEGNIVEQARLDYLLTDKRPSAAILAKFAEKQRPDGGWAPFWVPDYSSLDATCYHLAQLDQLGLDETEPLVAKALAFLQARQQVDGNWEEETAVSEQAPPWAKPGDAAAKLYLTANCGFWLARFGVATSRLAAAASLIAASQTANGSIPSLLHTNWLGAALLHMVGEAAAATAVLDYLATQLDKLSANNLTWLLVCFEAAQIDEQAHPFVEQAQEKLADMQQEDGRFVSDDMMEYDTHVTLEALRIFINL